MDEVIQRYIDVMMKRHGREYVQKLEIRHIGGGSIYIRHPDQENGYVVSKPRLERMISNVSANLPVKL